MDLERNTSFYPGRGYDRKEAEPWEILSAEEGGGIYANVYGLGSQNSTYAIYLKWTDVESVIQKFAEAGDANAVRLHKAHRLAEAVADLSR